MIPDDLLPHLIWATRGRSWGFRFLLDGGLSDPLAEYERAFRDAGEARFVSESYDRGHAVRFTDPSGRRDGAGRQIPHEFVILGGFGDLGVAAGQLENALWAVVSDAYSRVWDAPNAPTRTELGLSTAGT